MTSPTEPSSLKMFKCWFRVGQISFYSGQYLWKLYPCIFKKKKLNHESVYSRYFFLILVRVLWKVFWSSKSVELWALMSCEFCPPNLNPDEEWHTGETNLRLEHTNGRCFRRSFFTVLASSACSQTYARNTEHVCVLKTTEKTIMSAAPASQKSPIVGLMSHNLSKTLT